MSTNCHSESTMINYVTCSTPNLPKTYIYKAHDLLFHPRSTTKHSNGYCYLPTKYKLHISSIR